MFITPYFGGCKYTNNFLFINKNIVFQHFVLLITCHLDRVPLCHLDRTLYVISTERSEWRDLASMINCRIFHNFLYIWELGDSRSSREGQRGQAGNGGGQEQSKLV